MSNKPLLIVGADFAKSQIAAFTRKDGTFVQAHSDKRVAASKAPPIGHHAKALRESSKPGDMDHWHNQIAADQMAAGDHKALSGTLKGMDTAARDHVLEHIHPDHHAGLGFETINHARSVAGYDKKFPAAKPKAAKPAKAKDMKKPTSAGGYTAPKDGDVGHEEHTQYGAYFRKGDKVKDQAGVGHEVLSHRGPQVTTTGGGSYHPTKLKFASGSMEKSMLVVRPDLLK